MGYTETEQFLEKFCVTIVRKDKHCETAIELVLEDRGITFDKIEKYASTSKKNRLIVHKNKTQHQRYFIPQTLIEASAT